MVNGSSGFLDSYLPYLLRRADQTLSGPFYARLHEAGVARSEWRVLAVLTELGELGVGELASAALSPQPTVTHAVRRLEKRGLIRSVPGIDDRRQRLISVTESGAALTSTLIDEATRLAADALADAGDLATLADELRALTVAVEQRLVAEPEVA